MDHWLTVLHAFYSEVCPARREVLQHHVPAGDPGGKKAAQDAGRSSHQNHDDLPGAISEAHPGPPVRIQVDDRCVLPAEPVQDRSALLLAHLVGGGVGESRTVPQTGAQRTAKSPREEGASREEVHPAHRQYPRSAHRVRGKAL